MRILIIEEAVKENTGHWVNYIGDLAAGLRECGDQVDVLIHKEADPAIAERLRAIPWCRRSLFDGSRKNLAFSLVHPLSFQRDVVRYLRQAESYDVVMSLTMRFQHLVGWNLTLRSRPRTDKTCFLLLFVQGPGEEVPSRTGIPAIRQKLRSRLFRFLLRALRRYVSDGRIVLAAETGEMKERYERFSGLRFRQFPHPVRMRRRSPNGKGKSNDGLVLNCPGFARYEKGSDLLQRAMERFYADHAESRVRLVVQWLEPFLKPDGEFEHPSEVLLQDPRCWYIRHVLPPEKYDQTLRRTGVMVRPYRANAYAARVSRVAIEAAVLGIPMIYTRGTWLEERVGAFGAGIACENENVDSLYAAIVEMVNHYPEYRERARAKREAAREYFSVREFRRVLSEAIA